MNTAKFKQIAMHTHTQDVRGLPHTPTLSDSPEPSKELLRPAEKLLAEEEEEVVEEVGGSVEGKAGWDDDDGLW